MDEVIAHAHHVARVQHAAAHLDAIDEDAIFAAVVFYREHAKMAAVRKGSVAAANVWRGQHDGATRLAAHAEQAVFDDQRMQQLRIGIFDKQFRRHGRKTLLVVAALHGRAPIY